MSKSDRGSRKAKSAAPATEASKVTRAVSSFRGWATGWIVTIIIVPIALQLWTTHRNRAQLSISVAKALVGSIRTIKPDWIYEHRAVLDLQTGCVTSLIEYKGESALDLPPPLAPRLPRVVYGLYLENIGRSEITDIRLTFRSRRGGFEIAGSPQLAFATTQQLDPEGQTLQTVTIASMAPMSKGVITGTLPVADAELSLEESDKERITVAYDIGDDDPNLVQDRHVRFAGARQLSEAPLTTIAVDALYTQQQEAFGLEALPLPFDPIETGGLAGARFRMGGPYHTCPGVRCGTCYKVPVAQRSMTAEEQPMTPEERAAFKQRPRRPHQH